jgi:hypothetical protein
VGLIFLSEGEKANSKNHSHKNICVVIKTLVRRWTGSNSVAASNAPNPR